MTDRIYDETCNVSDPAAILSAEEKTKEVILRAMKFGQELIAEFGAQNVMSGKSVIEIATIAQALAPLQALLISGSLHTAKEWIKSSATDSIPQATKDHFLSRIDQYLRG